MVATGATGVAAPAGAAAERVELREVPISALEERQLSRFRFCFSGCFVVFADRV